MSIIANIIDLFFPAKCVLCGVVLPPGTRPELCGNCLTQRAETTVICSKCKNPIDTATRNPICTMCQNNAMPYNVALSAFVYDRQVRSAILRFKVSLQTGVGMTMADYLARQAMALGFCIQNIDAIVCVPSSNPPRNGRFNPAKVIAKRMAKKMKIPFVTALKKVKANQMQHTLSAEQRQQNIKGVYQVIDPALVKGKNLILVDDIFTTGATAAENARLLKQAGAENVFVFTLARPKH